MTNTGIALDFVLDPGSLTHEELEHELRLRNLTLRGSDRQKANELQEILRKEDVETRAVESANPDEAEFDVNLKTLHGLRNDLARAQRDGSGALINMVKSRMQHYVERAIRAVGDEKDHSALRATVDEIKIMSQEGGRASQIGTVSRAEPPWVNHPITNITGGRGRGRGSYINETNNVPGTSRTTPSEGNASTASSVRNAQRDNVSRCSGLQEEPAPNVHDRDAITEPPRTNKYVSIHKWKVNFSGEGGMSLSEFFLQIDFYMRAEHATRQQVYDGIFHLLSGRALEWYRGNYHLYGDWGELMLGLQTEFLPVHYEYLIREEILARIQAPGESFSAFLTAMNRLFQLVYPSFTEDYKIYVLRRNMQPQYAMQLSMLVIHSVDQMKMLCKQMDEVKLLDGRRKSSNMISNPMEPSCFPKSSKTKEKRIEELEALDTDKEHKVEEIRAKTNFQAQRREQPRKTTYRNKRGCWNCGKPGHRHFSCTQPVKEDFCAVCGEVGVTVLTCNKNHEGAKNQLRKMFPSSSSAKDDANKPGNSRRDS